MSKLDKNEVSRLQNSERACVFIDSSDPLCPNQVINGSSHPCFKPPFPPTINPRDLILKQSSNGKIMARAPNAFIIYRKLCVEAARSHGYYLPMTVISSMTSQSWEEESSDVKAEYKRIAQEANKYHREMYPKTGRRKKREKWNLVSFQPKSYLQEDSSKETKPTNNKPLIPSSSSKKIYPNPDISPDNYREIFVSKDIEQFQPTTEKVNSDHSINMNSPFNLEFPSSNLSSNDYFEIANIYEEGISNWNIPQNRVVSESENTFTSCHREDINYESNSLENSSVNSVNTSEGFDLSGNNLNVPFSVMMESDSYFGV
ncbi:11632_t:CDS:2 [Rhizophagus irregularis]|nr:11632_t:CDS:2 [Rhizophagus irregularis]